MSEKLEIGTCGKRHHNELAYKNPSDCLEVAEKKFNSDGRTHVRKGQK